MEMLENDGYSSEIGGIVSFAGAINDLAWVDSTDTIQLFLFMEQMIM